MPTSSAVLAAIVVVWIVYLVPQWMRRREALGQSRIEDRDSDQVRLLDRRRRGGDAGPSSGPLHPTVPGPHVQLAQELDVYREVADMAASSLPQSQRAVRRRTTVLVVLGALALAGWAAVPVASLAWWAALPTTLLLVADLVALRLAAQHRARRIAEHRAWRRAELEAAEEAREEQRRREDEAARVAARRAAAVPARTGVTVAGRRRAKTTEIVPTGEVPMAGETLTADGTWTPTPVPPPTYTLKPAVHRPRTTVNVPLAGSSSQLPEELGEPVPVENERRGAPLAPVVAPAAFSGRRRPEGDEAGPEGTGAHEWADGLDLDAVLARRRAVNG